MSLIRDKYCIRLLNVVFYKHKKQNARSEKWGVHMNEYRKLITQLINQMDDSDLPFLKKIYTLLIIHIRNKGKH